MENSLVLISNKLMIMLIVMILRSWTHVYQICFQKDEIFDINFKKGDNY